MIKIVFCVVCWFTLSLVGCLPASTVANNHVIGYPEVEENHRIKNKDGRHPIYVPSMCPDNELFYPGDQASDWICDCRPAHLYHPESNKCWPAWRQGPCPDGQYLVLAAASAIPVCRLNRCKDGYVLLNKKCLRLGSSEVCKHLFPNDAALGVNPTTLVVECVRLSSETNIPARPSVSVGALDAQAQRPQQTFAYSYLTSCAPGSKRKLNGQCEDGS